MREHGWPARAFRSKANELSFLFFLASEKGCGINVCTPEPVTALSLLSRPGERLDAETVLALVLTEFERLWTAFIAGGGSWAPFEEDYLDAWMHS
jgi:biotin---protein ligase